MCEICKNIKTDYNVRYYIIWEWYEECEEWSLKVSCIWKSCGCLLMRNILIFIFLAYKSLIPTAYFIYREKKELVRSPLPIARLQIILLISTVLKDTRGYSIARSVSREIKIYYDFYYAYTTKAKSVSRFFSSLNKTANLSFLPNLLNRF